MESSLSFSVLMALFAAMVVLAAVPSVSVLAVVARSASFGFRHGVATTVGIVLGDILFILVAIFGLSLVAETMGQYYLVLKYLGGGYLIGLGILLWRSVGASVGSGARVGHSSWWSSVLAGLLLTLGDQKAILFYLGFFPAFVDVHSLTLLDACWVIVTASVSLLSVKLVYAWLSAGVGLHIGAHAGRWMNRLAAGMLIGVGVFLLLKS